MCFLFGFYIFGSASLLEMGLQRLAPPFLNAWFYSCIKSVYFCASLLETGLHRQGGDSIYTKMPRNFKSRIQGFCVVFWFFFFLGHQSVRDRTAQAGAPILKCSVFIRRLSKVSSFIFSIFFLFSNVNGVKNCNKFYLNKHLNLCIIVKKSNVYVKYRIQ